jgi:uncharacterized protein YuzE
MDIIDYDPEADILVIRLSDGEVSDEKLLDNDIVLGMDKDDKIIYIEVWDASKKGLMKTLINLARKKENKIKTIIENIK